MKIPLLEELRGATRVPHATLEAETWGNKIKDGTLTEQEYLTLIAWQRRVHESLEPLIASFSIGDYHYHARFPLTWQPTTTELPDRATAIGILYVLEGASLGGSLIYQKLCANPALSAQAPFEFYRNQANVGLQQWRAFLGSLQPIQFTRVETQLAEGGAIATFRHFASEWSAQSSM